jgi:hypothetical protein
MIICIYGGELALRVLVGVYFRGVLSLSLDFELLLALLSLFCCFSCHFLAFRMFFLLDDLFYLSFGFWSSSCTSCVLDSKFKPCAFCCQCNHQGGD